MRAHIAKTMQTCFFYLRHLRQIRHLLGQEAATKLVLAFVISRLDYGNAVLAGLPQSIIAPLQRVLNAAARLVCGLRPRDHVTDAVRNLHWLPVEARIEFKLCVLVHQCLAGNAPSYLVDLVRPVADLQRNMTLRSVSTNELVVPRTRLKVGERAFKVAAATSWNRLPTELRQSSVSLQTFCKKLKTFLFSKYFTV